MTMNCPNCKAPITFWASLQQPTPFRFKCSRCKTRYKASTPYMRTIFVVAILISIGLVIAWFFGTRAYGFVFGLVLFALMIADWLLLELWAHHYIAEKGILTPFRSPHEPRER